MSEWYHIHDCFLFNFNHTRSTAAETAPEQQPKVLD